MLRSINPIPVLYMTVLPLLMAVAVATPAHASDEENQSAVVRTSDLDLNSAEGRKKLDRRIHRAARSVCGPDVGVSRISSHRCVRRAEANAWQNMTVRGFFAGTRRDSRPVAALSADTPNRGQLLGHLTRR